MFGKNKKTTEKVKKPQKVYKNSAGKVIYKQSTDKIGDVLVNQGGVSMKITGERFAPPCGYDDGKLKTRILTLTPDKKSGVPEFELNDTMVEHYRKNGVLIRQKKSVPKPKKTTTARGTHGLYTPPKRGSKAVIIPKRPTKTGAKGKK